MALIVAGRIAPLDPADPTVVFAGRVYLSDDGRVDSVWRPGQPVPAGFANAPEVAVGTAFVYPGLIDLHSHIGYNSLPLWVEPAQASAFAHHDRWPNAPSYKSAVSWPAYVLAAGAPEALLAYVQVRALAGGTTAIQGWPTANRNPVNRLVRNIDDEDLGSGNRHLIRTSALTLDVDGLRDRARHLAAGTGFIYHCGEGQVGSLASREFDDAAATNCLRSKLIAVHLNAIGPDGFRRWDERARLAGDPGPGAVVWSPFSNLWLYGQTTDVAAARAHHVTVCLGTDWGPSGSKNLLGELKVARLWSEHAGLGLTAFDLAQMVTSAPGDMLARCWPVQAGRLVPGALADVAVLAARAADPWENLVLAREEDVQLVLVDGAARLGTKALMEAAGALGTASVSLGGGQRRHVPLVDPAAPAMRWTWAKVMAAFRAVQDDPAAAVATGLQAMAALAGRSPSTLSFDDPLLLELDMPGPGGVTAGPPPDPASVHVPLPGSLSHDAEWRASVRGRGFHGGLLDGLDRFYA